MQYSRLLLLLGSIAVTACRSNNLTPESPTATIKGRVKHMDCLQTVTSHSGITVTLTGTPYSAVSDDSGYYTLNNVPQGTYDVDFSQHGYGTVRWFSRTVIGGGNAPVSWLEPAWTDFDPAELYKIPDLRAVIDSASIRPPGNAVDERNGEFVHIAGHFVTSLPYVQRAVAIFIGRDESVSSTPGHYVTYLINPYDYFGPDTNGNIAGFHLNIPLGLLKQYGLEKRPVYFSAYGYHMYCGNEHPKDYYDPFRNVNVLTSIDQTLPNWVRVELP